MTSKRKRPVKDNESRDSIDNTGNPGLKDASESLVSSNFTLISEPTMDLFLSWCRHNGAHGTESLIQVVEKKIGWRTVTTNKAIEATEEFASIPCELVLDEMVAGRSELGRRVVNYLKELEGKNVEMPNRHRALLLSFLVYERFQRENSAFDLNLHGTISSSDSIDSKAPSPWYPYLAVLPSTFDDPLHWPADEVARELTGTNLAHYLSSRLSDLRSDLSHAQSAVGDLFSPGVLEWENWMWANSAVYSRAFPGKWTPFSSASPKQQFELGNPAKEACGLALLPFLDMINHNPTADVLWSSGPALSSPIHPESNRVRFNHPPLAKPIAGGAEVLNNYGAKSNEEFLIGYGFVVERNEADTVRVLVNDARAQDPEFVRKARVLSEVNGDEEREDGENEWGDKAYGLEPGQHLFHLRRKESPGALFRLMKCLCLDAWELDRLDSEDIEVDELMLQCQVRLRASARLYGLLGSKKEAIARTHKEAEKFWSNEGKRTYRAKCASILRKGQMDILQHAMWACKLYVAETSESYEFVHLAMIIGDEEFQELLEETADGEGQRLELDEDEMSMVYLAVRFPRWLERDVKDSLEGIDGALEEQVDAVLGQGSSEDLRQLWKGLRVPVGAFDDELGVPSKERIMLAAVALQRYGVEMDPALVNIEVDEGGQEGAKVLVIPVPRD
jgi:hypothetical protein